jgi:hypothetical protein
MGEELLIIAKRFNEMIDKSKTDDGSLTPADVCDVIQDIPSLFVEIDRLTKELDAAIEDLKRFRYCSYCKYYNPVFGCLTKKLPDKACWEWRGVKEKNYAN